MDPDRFDQTVVQVASLFLIAECMTQSGDAADRRLTGLRKWMIEKVSREPDELRQYIDPARIFVERSVSILASSRAK